MERSPGWIHDLLARLHATPADPARVLQAEVAGLEAGLAAAEQQLAAIRAAAHSAERSAMEAIRAGNDHAARVALLEQQGFAEQAARVEADVTVVRALLEECRDFLASLPDSPLPPA